MDMSTESNAHCSLTWSSSLFPDLPRLLAECLVASILPSKDYIGMGNMTVQHMELKSASNGLYQSSA